MVLYQRVLLFLLFLSQSYCYTFNTKEVTVITDSETTGRYFGYTVLLQNGNVPIVTVGAPKGKSFRTKQYEGEVFQCKVNHPSNCQTVFKNQGDFYSPNGDFLGAALDGEDNAHGLVMTCSPRTMVRLSPIDSKIYMYGKCLFRKNSTNTQEKAYEVVASEIKQASPRIRNPAIGTTLFYYAYAQLGFDISIYEKGNVLCGLPGLFDAGGAITFSASTFENSKTERNVTRIPPTNIFSWTRENQYFGYSLKATKVSGTKETLFSIGEPRGNNLRGKVHLYLYSAEGKLTEKQILLGNEFGSYFGASVLAVDLAGQGMLDILVGAPLSAGKTYEEGYVYYFRSFNNAFHQTKKLTGLNKERGRFGMSMASLGDFDLDGFNDVAISAPYEDNDKGSVYIYRGSLEGLQNQFSQRLSPATINNALTAKGFGLGLSRGNDIDNNGHNDVAIGAHKSGQVFIIKSYGIVDCQAVLTTNISALKENALAFELQVNVKYSKRSARLNIPWLDFDLRLYLDSRSVQEKIDDVLRVRMGQALLKAYPVRVQPISRDIAPFVINAELAVKDKNIKAFGNVHLKTEIPYAIGCSGKVCLTGLSLQVKTKRSRIVLGQDHQVDLEVTVTNYRDPAFQCILIIQAPPVLPLRTLRDCDHKDGNYSCLFSEKLDRNKSKTGAYIFDVKGLTLQVPEVQINVSVISYGINNKSYKNKEVLTIPVMSLSTSYMAGASLPNSMNIERALQNNTEVIHRFTIGKQGTMPLKLNATVLIPVQGYLGEQLFSSIQISNEDGLMFCKPFSGQINVNATDLLNRLDLESIPQNRSLMIYCHQLQECARYTCQGLLESAVQKTIIEIRLSITSRLIVDNYQRELQTKNIIAYLPVVVLHNSAMAEDKILEPAPFLIFVQYVKYLPLWIFLVSCITGLILLLLLVILLNKCRFFQRDYKHLIEQEISNDTKKCKEATSPSTGSKVQNIYS